MITGFHPATAGTVTVEGKGVPEQLDEVYALMGNCPQHDLLWDILTGREHLMVCLRGDSLELRFIDGSILSFDFGHESFFLFTYWSQIHPSL